MREHPLHMPSLRDSRCLFIGFYRTKVQWHVVLPNSFDHLAFDDVPWFSEKGEVFGSAF